MNNIFLKIKGISLAQEARLIRKYERQRLRRNREVAARKDEPVCSFDPIYQSLSNHRKMDIRRESRATHLARGFLSGMDYRRMERDSYQPPDWDKVERMILKYGSFVSSQVAKQRLEEWKSAPPLPAPELPPRVKKPFIRSELVTPAE